ncbi:MAG: hypothetical protein FRX48_06546 [Lasallia pustulata]|uniref:Uncharacterized protein n=1 Tax=Lasallia pustulata TaxID=136370 RepID=A0A5M8PKG0_9LECA|nr:MAG: hypothetical protein FRX48_06546 [Lasallia pustulata]
MLNGVLDRVLDGVPNGQDPGRGAERGAGQDAGLGVQRGAGEDAGWGAQRGAGRRRQMANNLPQSSKVTRLLTLLNPRAWFGHFMEVRPRRSLRLDCFSKTPSEKIETSIAKGRLGFEQ